MIEEIKHILERELWANQYSVLGIGDAAQAIAGLVERQPVDRVRAMAMFVKKMPSETVYDVPIPNGNGESSRVLIHGGVEYCVYQGDSCSDSEKGDRPCEHIQAVKLYQKQSERENG